MSSADDNFSAHFWAHMERPLRNLITAHARCVAANAEDYTEAFDAIWHDALRHGALHMAKSDRDALEDWLGYALFDAVIEAEADGWDRWPRYIPEGWNPYPQLNGGTSRA